MPKRKRSTDGGGVGGKESKIARLHGGATKRNLPGIASSGQGKYRRLEQDLDRRSTQIWRPVPNSDLKNEDMIEFSMTVRADEMVRFPENPLCLLVDATVANPDYVPLKAGEARPDTATVDQIRERDNLDPQGLAPAIFIEGVLGARAFFEKIDVLINGMPVDFDEMGNFGHIFQCLNRIFTDVETKRDRYGGVPRCSTSNDMKAPDVATGKYKEAMSNDLLESMESLQYVSKSSGSNRVMRFNFDCKW